MYHLNSSRFGERGEGAVLLDSLEAFYGNIDDDRLAELGDVDTALLEIGLSAHLAGRVELGRAGTVRVPPADLGCLAGDFAGACHSRRMVALGYKSSKHGHPPLLHHPHPLHHRA